MEESPIKVFIVYAHEDKPVRDKLIKQFRPLVHNQEIDLWSDHEIMPGDLWDDEIRKRLKSSDLILLLISDDFFASEYINQVELQEVLSLHRQGKTRLLPIIARHCGWEEMKYISNLQALPPEGKPIVSKEWSSADEPYHTVFQGVKLVIRDIKKSRKDLNKTNKPTPVNQKNNSPSVNAGKRFWIAFSLTLCILFSIWLFSRYLYNPYSIENSSTSKQSAIPHPNIINPLADPQNTATSNLPASRPPVNDPVTDTSHLVEKPQSLQSKKKSGKNSVEDYKQRWPESEGMIRVLRENGTFGFINAGNSRIIGWYQDAEDFYNGRSWVRKNGTYFWIDKNGKCIEKCPD